jgi:adenine-specific DNA-methyltransferase
MPVRTSRQEQMQTMILQLLPPDRSPLPNHVLYEQLKAAAGRLRISEDEFHEVRESLVEAGLIVKGKGRGGSTSLADRAAHATFQLKAPEPPAEITPIKTKSRKTNANPRASAAEGEPQVLSYRHADRRKNNPEVGLVSEASDPEQPKTAYAYDPHLDPTLQFDSGRARTEKLIDDALAGDNPAQMRAALEQLRRQASPYLQWTGKAERTTFEVDTVSLHVHERIDAMSILSAVSKQQGNKGEKSASAIQPGLFEAPFESLPLRSAIDFYKHDRGWANRLIAGDSLLVMNSLLQKESMAGQVQMIYIDPPYGIKYGSNFQPFTNRREVQDRTDADLTQEPEMIKAFRDTWELGLHSYLTYLRDRLLLARDLLADAGSVFVQISEENLHHVREILDEVFGPKNLLSVISFKKTGSLTDKKLASVCDYLLWYAKNADKAKFRPLLVQRDSSDNPSFRYYWGQDGRVLTETELRKRGLSTEGRTLAQSVSLTSQHESKTRSGPVAFFGQEYHPPSNRQWSEGETGITRLIRASRVFAAGQNIRYAYLMTDNPLQPLSNMWTDGGAGSFTEDQTYVVQTATKIVQRCVLMSTDPGDLVFDPTCGSGTTAYVAEKWGRRWITCDTSRIAVTLAKQRLMTANYDYYELQYPHEGLKGGFIYKTSPRITSNSIAENPEIDAIYDRHHPGIEAKLYELNRSLAASKPNVTYLIPAGVRAGQRLNVSEKGHDLLEWEVPFEWPADWPASVKPAFDAFHATRLKMQVDLDRSIASQADSATLFDRPEVSKTRFRITGPFTVEAVPFPTVLSLAQQTENGTQSEADAAVARSGATSRQHMWRDELLKAGVRGKGGQKLTFAELEVLPGAACLHASGHLDSGERVVISFGPEHGALEQRQVEHALHEAEALRPSVKFVVFCAFAFDPEAAKDIDEVRWPGVTLLKAQMNTDLLTEDLKKARASNQSFWLMGQPDVELLRTKAGLWQVEVNGFDYFDTAKGELISGGKAKIAAWSLDTDYDGRSLFPHQFFFPMADKDEGWMKLRKDIRAELDEELLRHFIGTVSLPFEAGPNKTVAVKIVDDRGIESLKIMRLNEAEA